MGPGARSGTPGLASCRDEGALPQMKVARRSLYELKLNQRRRDQAISMVLGIVLILRIFLMKVKPLGCKALELRRMQCNESLIHTDTREEEELVIGAKHGFSRSIAEGVQSLFEPNTANRPR